jgi:hypothetical protein
MMAAYLTVAIVILGVSALLIWHRDYEDGFVGRFALGVMSMGALVLLIRAATSEARIPPEVELLLLGVALFMARHAYRFLRYRATGTHSWRPASK